MSIDPQTLWWERFHAIGELIEKNVEPLVQRWSERAIKEQPCADRTHHDQLRDSMPALLREIGRALADSSPAHDQAHRLTALEHGEQRWQVGWQLNEVVRDYQILRLVILEFLDSALSEPLQTREVMAIGLALDEAITASVVAYVHNQESQLRSTQERMTEFLALLSHELRDPLAPLHTALEVARLCQKPGDKLVDEALQTAQRSLHHVTRLVDDLLDVSRVAAGKLTLAKQHTKLNDIVDRAVELTLPLIRSRQHELHVQRVSEDLWLIADPVRLTQVLVNLLNNAAKYTPPGGRIELVVEHLQSDAVVHIHDNGIGISSELLPHIFDFFVQAETGTDRASNGLGIGLALVSRLVELHGGSIAAASPGLNRGSEFTIRVPLAPASPLESQPSSMVEPEVTAGRVKRVLVVDDNLDGATMLSMYLEGCGHKVEMGHNAEDALRQLTSLRPDVAILDIGLPQTDGYEVAPSNSSHCRWKAHLLDCRHRLWPRRRPPSRPRSRLQRSPREACLAFATPPDGGVCSDNNDRCDCRSNGLIRTLRALIGESD